MNKDDLIKKLKIEDVTKENQAIILENVANVVSTRIMVLIAEKLNDTDLDELNRLVDEQKDDEVESFIKSKFENYDQFASEVENQVIEELANSNEHLISAVNSSDDNS